MEFEERAISARRLGEAIDLGLEHDDLLTGISESGNEPRIVVSLSSEFAAQLLSALLDRLARWLIAGAGIGRLGRVHGSSSGRLRRL